MARKCFWLGLACAATAIALATGGQARAGTLWDGGGADNNWGTAANWNPDGVPVNDGTAVILVAGSTRPTPNVNVPWSIQSLLFDAGTAAFTVGGSTLTINASPGVRNLSSNLQTVNTPITLAVASHFDAYTGNLTIGGAVNNGGFLLTVWGSYTTTVSGAISGNGGLTKTEDGTLTLSGSSANVYTGTTTVSAGTLVLDRSVVDGAIAKDLVIGDGFGTDTVRLNQNNQISQASGNTVTINSSGVLDLNAHTETLYNLTMTGGGQVIGTGMSFLQVLGTVTTNASTATATISSGQILATGGQVPFVVADGGAAVDLDVSGAVGSTGGTGMVKSEAGTMRLSGTSANAYVGVTTVNEGVLLLGKTAGVDAIAHDLVIGDGAGADVVRLAAANQVNDASNVAITSSGLLDLSGSSDVIGPLTMTSGSVTTGAGTLGLAGTVTTNGHASSATISGNVNLNAADREFSVADGAAAYDLDLAAVLSGGGLVKTGTGTMRLSGAGANTHTGATTVNEGTLVLDKSVMDGAIAKDLVIGDGTGTDTVRLNQDNQVSHSGGNTVTINSSGVLDVNGRLDVIYNLTMTGGGQAIGTGASRLLLNFA